VWREKRLGLGYGSPTITDEKIFGDNMNKPAK
jgi:hypothetical protein